MGLLDWVCELFKDVRGCSFDLLVVEGCLWVTISDVSVVCCANDLYWGMGQHVGGGRGICNLYD